MTCRRLTSPARLDVSKQFRFAKSGRVTLQKARQHYLGKMTLVYLRLMFCYRLYDSTDKLPRVVRNVTGSYTREHTAKGPE